MDDLFIQMHKFMHACTHVLVFYVCVCVCVNEASTPLTCGFKFIFHLLIILWIGY